MEADHLKVALEADKSAASNRPFKLRAPEGPKRLADMDGSETPYKNCTGVLSVCSVHSFRSAVIGSTRIARRAGM